MALSTQNLIEVIDKITLRSLEMAQNRVVFSRYCNRGFEDEFGNKSAQIGSTLRVRLPWRPGTSAEGFALQTKSLNQRYTTVALTKELQQSIALSAVDETLRLEDFMNQVQEPMLNQMCTDMDLFASTNVYWKIANSVGTPGTTPGTLEVYNSAQTLLNLLGCPSTNRSAVIDANANAQFINNMKGLYNPSQDISDQFKTGMITNNFLGLNVAWTQNLPHHLTGTRPATGLVINGTVSTQGQSTISFDGGSGSITVKKGDVLSIAGVYAVNPLTYQSIGQLAQFTVMEDATASGGSFTNVSISPAIYTTASPLATVDSFPQDEAAVTFLGAPDTSYPQNLVFHRDSISVLMANLVNPIAGAISSQRNYDGFNIQITRGYDITQKQNIHRLDGLIGADAIRPEWAVRVWG